MQPQSSLTSIVAVLAMLLLAGSIPSEARAKEQDAQDPTIIATMQVAYLQPMQTDGAYVVWVVDLPSTNGTTTSEIWAADVDERVPFRVTTAVLAGSPALDKGIVVWTERVPDADPDDTDIRGMILSTQEPLDIETGPASAFLGDISGDLVVWSERPSGSDYQTPSDIRGRDLATGDTLTIATTQLDERNPLISGTRIAWLEMEGETVEELTATILLRDLATDAPPITIASVPAWRDNTRIHGITLGQLDGDRLLWSDWLGQDHPSKRVWTYRLGDDEPRLFATIERHSWSGPDHDLSGDLLAVTGRVIDLSTGAWVPTGIDAVLSTDGRYVFGSAFVQYPEHINLVGYDTYAGSRFVVHVDEPTSQIIARDGIVVWTSPLKWPDYAVHVALIRDLLPSAPRAAVPDTPEQPWFAETGHTLRWGFRDYWAANGGLPVFGYPLTEEFGELNTDTGADYTVQFIERQRFEYHPENVGTPYEVLLGRLGAERAAQQGLIAADPFLPRPGVGGDPRHVYMAETGHWLSNSFLDYWRVHGLDLGDPGVSYRESLTLFGYPLSEEYVDPGTGLTTQYFERAVFEYHPDNPDEYTVLLRRLGAEALAARGW
jgi:hypothetical protein